MDQPKIILLLTSDANIKQELMHVLSPRFSFRTASSFEEALSSLEQNVPDLLVLDYHLEGEDGLEVFKQVRRRQPRLKTLLLVLPSDIEVAVQASRLGVLDVVRKPIEMPAFLSAIHYYLEQSDFKRDLSYSDIANTEWLEGVGTLQSRFMKELLEVSQGAKDVVLVGAKGVPTSKVAEVIHRNSLKHNRKLVALDLVSFQNESSESYFWAMIRELLLEQEEVSDQSGELCGTLFLDNFGAVEQHFQTSILEFLREEKVSKKRGKVDQGIKIILSVCGREILSSFPPALLENFIVLEIPLLKDRKEDLPVLVGDLVAKFNAKHGKNVQAVSLPVLNLLSHYDFPGNYAQLESLLESALLLAEGPQIGLKEIPINLHAFLVIEVSAALRQDIKRLDQVLTNFSRGFYTLLLEKAGGDESKVARFLDLPLEGLTTRLRQVGLL